MDIVIAASDQCHTDGVTTLDIWKLLHRSMRREDALTYSASSSNAGVARVSVAGSTVTISAAVVGSATVTVTARDPGGQTATQTASVTVRAAGAPNLVFASVSQDGDRDCRRHRGRGTST